MHRRDDQAKWGICLRTLGLFLCLRRVVALAQEPSAGWQVRPSLTANFDLGPHSRIQVFERFEDGTNYPYRRLRVGAAFSHRMNRILKPHPPEIDDEDEHNLVIGGGYELLKRTQDDFVSREHRVFVEATPRYLLGAGFLATDRNRVEFRWINGHYNVRYRNRLAVLRPLKAHFLRFTPYASGELFYDRNLHSWNRKHYGFGAQFAGKGRLMIDTYYLRENCTGCSPNRLNLLGVTFNVYFKGE